MPQKSSPKPRRDARLVNSKVKRGWRSLVARATSIARGQSHVVLALSAVVALLLSVVGLWQTSRYNLRSFRLQADMATEQATANQTQAAQAGEAMGYQALSAHAAQTQVAQQDKE